VEEWERRRAGRDGIWSGADPYEFFAWLHYSLPGEASRNCKVKIIVFG
jgi:hypothetical protein